MPEPNYSTGVSHWLQRAQDDVRWAQVSFKDEIYYGACFVSQQAIEKVLKAFLLQHNQKFPKIHDLPTLLQAAAKHDKTLLKFLDKVIAVNDYYTNARYPDLFEFQHYSKAQAKEACVFAEEIVLSIDKTMKVSHRDRTI